VLDKDAIKAIIPHREPFLLLDRVEEYVPGESCTAYLEVTGEMFWVPGHFPEYPVMPGVLIVEALAQAGSIAMLSLEANQGKIGFFAGIDKVRFKRVVKPGDTMRLEAEITSFRGPVGKCSVKATVDGQLACRGELMFAIVDAGAIAAGEAKL
jgi:3-hydroxyacyl-[acyl-carrier-protein] dehydratase